MTKEEYTRLLQSDYWKGYSYSLIKERNYTCEDCGKCYKDERNKLQVHHLVYRDVYPWSYRPEEVVVLCKECHQRRHGIVSETQSINAENKTASDNVNQATNSECATTQNDFEVDNSTVKYGAYPNDRRGKAKLAILICLLIILLFLGLTHGKLHGIFPTKTSTEDICTVSDEANETRPSVQVPKATNSNSTKNSRNEIKKIDKTPLTPPTAILETQETIISNEPSEIDIPKEKSTLEILEERNHADAVKRAERAGVSTEGTTLEILERINHADVVKRAEKAGVSTEGTTLEILERMNHADVIKRAEKAGVSTEGTTLEILERINHADVVKRAEKAGVSTEGTTLEILERLNRTNLSN